MKNRAEQKVNNKTFCEINPWPQMTKQVALDIFTKTCQRCHTGYTKNYAHDWCFVVLYSWWRHQIETFSALQALCAGNSPVTGEFPSQRPVTRRFDVFFDLGLNKRWSKQSRHRWFDTASRSLWCHCNGAYSAVDISRKVTSTGAIMCVSQYQWKSNPEDYGEVIHLNQPR